MENLKSILIRYIVNLIQYIKNAYLLYGSVKDFQKITFEKIGVTSNICDLFKTPLGEINSDVLENLIADNVDDLFKFFEKIDFNKIIYHIKNCNRKNIKKGDDYSCYEIYDRKNDWGQFEWDKRIEIITNKYIDEFQEFINIKYKICKCWFFPCKYFCQAFFFEYQKNKIKDFIKVTGREKYKLDKKFIDIYEIFHCIYETAFNGVFLLPFPPKPADLNNITRLELNLSCVSGSNPYNNREWRHNFWNFVLKYNNYDHTTFLKSGSLHIVQWGRNASNSNDWNEFREKIAIIQIDLLTFMIMDLTNILNDPKRLHEEEKNFKKYVKRGVRSGLNNLQNNIKVERNNLKSRNSRNPNGGSRKIYKAKKRKTVNARRRRITRKM